MAHVKSIIASHYAVSAGSRALAAACLIYFAPVLLAAAILVNLQSAGPVFVKSNKRTADGQTIRVWAFRTNTIGNRDRGAPDYTASRPTRLGVFLRKSRMALLPRLLNALRGELLLGEVFR